MSSQLVSIIPPSPLTDNVFPFNEQAFLDIRNYQQQDLGILSSPPVRALVDVGNVAGGVATGVTAGVGSVAQGAASTLFGGLGKVTSGLPGGGLLGQVGQTVVSGIGATDAVAQQLVDPSRVLREHIMFSNDVKDHLPAAIAAVDDSIYTFSIGIGQQAQELYENIATKGLQIIIGLEGKLADVDGKLAGLINVLTRNNLEENLQVGQDKYKAIQIPGVSKIFLGDIAVELPKVLKIINDVRGAFAAILANLKLAATKINSGVTEPNQIFAEKSEDVVTAWQNFEVKRKSMTYLPYKY